MSDLVTVSAFESLPQAQLVRSLLEAEGIQAMVIGQDMVSADAFLAFYPDNRVRVQVLKSDKERAMAVLEKANLPVLSKDTKHCCPRCGSCLIESARPQIRTTKNWKIIFIPFVYLIGFLKGFRRCKECSYFWK